MPRSSSILFALILALSFALVVWWTCFQLIASDELQAAGDRLVAGDIPGAAQALGAADAADLTELARRRRAMFASEGAFFAVVLLGLGWLYVASVRRAVNLRAAQDRFLAAATHELKTPLATIVLLLESLRDGRVPTEKHDRWLANGLLEAARLEHGLDNVLGAAGLRAAPHAPRLGRGDLADDVRAAVEAIRPRAFAADVALHVDAPAQLPLLRDATAMQMVLRNLLDNAVKYSAPGQAVHVAVAARDGIAEVVVRDGGRGMDADELAHAFEPFWRGRDTATGGTGLGLHLVRELVQAHGGSVAAASDGRGRGSRFTLRLPQERSP